MHWNDYDRSFGGRVYNLKPMNYNKCVLFRKVLLVINSLKSKSNTNGNLDSKLPDSCANTEWRNSVFNNFKGSQIIHKEQYSSSNSLKMF
jgi:hypothetical protein